MRVPSLLLVFLPFLSSLPLTTPAVLTRSETSTSVQHDPSSSTEHQFTPDKGTQTEPDMLGVDSLVKKAVAARQGSWTPINKPPPATKPGAEKEVLVELEKRRKKPPPPINPVAMAPSDKKDTEPKGKKARRRGRGFRWACRRVGLEEVGCA